MRSLSYINLMNNKECIKRNDLLLDLAPVCLKQECNKFAVKEHKHIGNCHLTLNAQLVIN